MKVAVSIPDRLFEEAEDVSKRLGVSRSRLYAEAVAAHVKRHRGKTIRDALDAVYRSEKSSVDAALTDLQARALREEW